METERYLLNKEYDWKTKKRFREKSSLHYQEVISDLLIQSNYEDLVNVLESDTFRDNFSLITESAYLILASQIYKAETHDGIHHTIFSGRKTQDEIISCIQQLKFLLWRICFGCDAEAVPSFFDFMHAQNISTHCLQMILQISGIDNLSFMEKLNAAQKESIIHE